MMKKVNILYIFWVILFLVACLIVKNFVASSQSTIFGTAETEGQLLNFGQPVVISKVLVKMGSPVRKGDKNKEIQVTNAEKQANMQDFEQEIAMLRSTFALKKNEISAQIQLLEAEEKTQAALRKMVNNGKTDNTKSILVERINTLKKTLSIEKQRFVAQLNELERTKSTQSSVFDSKESAANQEIDFIAQAQNKLALISPINGFVESIFAFDNQIVPQYNPLIKLNPQKPNKVKGFLPESINIAYQLGDTVEVHAARRPKVKSKAILIGSNPQIIELPTRLRKFQSATTWGRELYLNLLPNNDFFIGEKIIIQMKGR
jgi:uncharacterized Zn ribbon protein